MLRALFDEVIELDAPERAARIAALALSEEARARLQAMVVFDEVIDLHADLRAARLAALQPAPAVAARVQAMLDAHERGPDLLRATAAEAIERIRGDDLGQSLVGTSIGDFRLLELIGQGGSSVVFRAERDAGDGAQTVALKLLRTGLYSADAQRRFRREQAILAQLRHPNIARLIEGGVSSAGIPYIAMELIDGLPITESAIERRLDVAGRLRCFRGVCRTIEAAHAALIVHRDLKPSNLLVTGACDLKVLDFGIAKLIDEDDYATRTQSVLLTPGYAAPEQYSAVRPTTAVDVYALGVVLGEMLTGMRLSGRTRASVAVAAQRDCDALLPDGLPPRRVLARQLRGDLDAILATALAEEPERRYRSADAFADDIDRYLGGRPVRAHPPSRWYRARKFAVRHRGAVAFGAAFALAILASLGVAAWQAHSIAREAQRAESMRDFLLRVFDAAAPAGPRLAPPSVADVVRASVAEAQHSASLQPAVRIELVDALGGVLRKQGDVQGSLRLLEENYRNAVATLGASDQATVLAGLGLAHSRAEAGQSASARQLLDNLLQQAAADSALRSRLLSASAELGIERFERQRALAESAVAVAACAVDCDERTRIQALVTRGNVLSNFNAEPAAIPVLEQAIELQRRMFGGPHIEIADTLEVLSRAYRRIGRLDRAEALAREMLAIVEASLPDPHQRRASAIDALRQVLIDSRKFDEAIELGLRVIAIDEATRGPAHPALATDQNTLGFTYMLRGDFGLAAKRFRAALAIAETIPGNQRRAAIYQADLGYSIGLGGDTTAAVDAIRAALARFRSESEVDYSEVASALEKLGDLQRRSGRTDDALATFAESDGIYRERLKTAPSEWHARTLVGLGRTLADRGDDAARAERSLREALAKIPAPKTRISPLRVEAEAALAEQLARKGKLSEARRLLAAADVERNLANGTLPKELDNLLDRARDAAGLAQPSGS